MYVEGIEESIDLMAEEITLLWKDSSSSSVEATLDKVAFTVAAAELVEVKFDGLQLMPDPTIDNLFDSTYEEYGHWVDHDGDGAIEPIDGDMQLPEAFVRGTKAKANVKLKVFDDSATKPDEIEVRGFGDDGIDFPAAVASLGDDGYYHYSAEATQEFLNTVHHYDDFTIRWQVKLPGGEWRDAGTSKNDIYLVLDEPAGNGPLSHTFVHVGSHYAAGSMDEVGLINGVWSHFQGLDVKRQDETTHIGSTEIPDVGNPFEYWEDYDNVGPVLLYGSGRCGDFASFFLDVLAAQGIHQDNNLVHISDNIFVNNWLPQGPQVNTNQGLVDVVVYDFVGDTDTDGDGFNDVVPKINANATGYNVSPQSQLTDGQGLPGQNSPNPRASFMGHQWVQVTVAGQVRWLDPSYGVEYVGANAMAKLNDFEDKALYGFIVGGVVDLELAMNLDLDRDGNITADADVSDFYYYDAIRRQSPGMVEVNHAFNTWTGA